MKSAYSESIALYEPMNQPHRFGNKIDDMKSQLETTPTTSEAD